MKPSEYIRKGWCQDVSALDSEGQPVKGRDESACAWCIHGAFDASLGKGITRWGDDWVRLGNHLNESPIDWNDTPGRTQDEVIAALEAVGL